MKSVADQLRRDTLSRALAQTRTERIRLALKLGERDVGLLAASQRVSRQEARRRIGQQRQRGRLPSPCHEGLFA
jgi:hypothetical protein